MENLEGKSDLPDGGVDKRAEYNLSVAAVAFGDKCIASIESGNFGIELPPVSRSALTPDEVDTELETYTTKIV
jgi:hypothetical protein